jgi:N-acetylmuramoyl-L-alanine amidase
VKRLFAILACLIVCMLWIDAVYANSYTGYQKVNTGVVINGTKVNFERQPVIKNGRILVPARTACNSMGARVDWYEKQGNFEIIKGSKVLKMYIGNNKAVVGGSSKPMDVEPFLLNGTVMVPLRFAAESLGYNVSMDTRSNNVYISSGGSTGSRGEAERKFKVVIDPGHGGYETGAIVSGIYEKNLNLDIAKRLKALLDAEGIKTYMTRTDDSRVGLYERSGLANSVDADLLISIHNNAQNQKSVSGSMSLYYPLGGNSKGNLTAKEFASIVQNRITKDLGTKNLGIIERPNLAVLRTSKMPAVLAEIGYMTNAAELKNLNSASFRQKAAESLKDAILTALSRI